MNQCACIVFSGGFTESNGSTLADLNKGLHQEFYEYEEDSDLDEDEMPLDQTGDTRVDSRTIKSLTIQDTELEVAASHDTAATALVPSEQASLALNRSNDQNDKNIPDSPSQPTPSSNRKDIPSQNTPQRKAKYNILVQDMTFQT